MKSQIYGILGLMYTLAIGILLVVALVGTSKQFTWQSSAPLYKFSMMELSSNVQKVKTFLSEERVYAADKALFYVGAFGGYSTFHDLVPKLDAKLCGCPAGTSMVNVNKGSCTSSDTKCYCENSNGNFVKPNLCFVNDETGKKLDVGVLNSSLWTYFPEKYFVYWYNGTEEVPTENKIKKTAEEYMDFLFPNPDPRIAIPLEILGTKMNFKYVTKINNFSNDYVDIEWIPIGQNSLIFDFPMNNPFIEYMMKLAIRTKIRNNLFGLYEKSSDFVKNKKFDSIFNDASKGILPTVIDENYVIGYNKKDVGTYHCNYSVSDRPDGNPKCSLNNVDVNNLKPMVALIYYIDNHYWYTSGAYNIKNMGSDCSSCSNKPNYLSLSETDLENSLPCTAEITPKIQNGDVVFRIDKFYGCQNNNNLNTNLNTNLTCMMCAIVSEINKEIGGGRKDIYTSKYSSWEYVNSLSDSNYSVKMLPLEKFNLTLSKNVETKTYVWKSTSFSAWIKPPHNYSMSSDSGCNNIDNGGQVGADSICELNGFQKATECVGSAPTNPIVWEYNVTMYKTISCPSSYHKIDNITCNNNQVDLNSKYGISVCGKNIGSGWIRGDLLNKLKNDDTYGTKTILGLLGYACEVEGGSLVGIHVKKETLHTRIDPYLYLSGIYGVTSHNIGGNYGGVVNITCSNGHTYNSLKGSETILGVDYSGLSGNFSETTSFNKIYDWYNTAQYGGTGKDITNVFCELKCGEGCTAKSMWVTNDSSYSSYYLKYGKFNLSITEDDDLDFDYGIDKIDCGDGKILVAGSSSEVGFYQDVGINLPEVPFSMVKIYTPENFANQTIILERVCSGNRPLSVHFNDSGSTPGLLIDPGKGNSNPSTYKYQLSKIGCVIK